MEQGRLYIVATPIGNLEDLSARAARILTEVDLIAAEDTRHTRRLLTHCGITTPLVAYHEHNEDRSTGRLIDRLRSGQSIALVSDAGTPLLSDPGYPLVTSAREAGIEVVAVPGPSALTAALSIAGLPVSRFVFEGFLPADGGGRRARLRESASEARTLVYYEAPHRILKTLEDMVDVFGAERIAALARELTKVHEEVRRDTLGELVRALKEGDIPRKGEFVVMVAGAASQPLAGNEEEWLAALLPELPPRKAVEIVARITGFDRRALYRRAVELRGRERDPREG